MPTSLPRASVVVGYGMATTPMAAFLSGPLVEIAVPAWIVAALAAMGFDRERFARFRGAPVLPATRTLLAAWTLARIVAKLYPRLPSIVPLLFPLVFSIAQPILTRLPASRRWLLVSARSFVVEMGVLAMLQVFFDVPIRNGPEEWGWWRMHPDYPFHCATGLYQSPSHVAAAVGSSFLFFLGMGFGGTGALETRMGPVSPAAPFRPWLSLVPLPCRESLPADTVRRKWAPSTRTIGSSRG
jgi:hypothetical protein